jgi:hypothetical protein
MPFTTLKLKRRAAILRLAMPRRSANPFARFNAVAAVYDADRAVDL